MPGGGTPKESIDPELLKTAPDIFMAMIDTADIVAERYKLSREYQDEFSLESQRRMAAAQQANKFKDEIVPRRLWKVLPSWSRSRAPASTSPPATPASSRTARLRSC